MSQNSEAVGQKTTRETARDGRGRVAAAVAREAGHVAQQAAVHHREFRGSLSPHRCTRVPEEPGGVDVPLSQRLLPPPAPCLPAAQLNHEMQRCGTDDM